MCQTQEENRITKNDGRLESLIAKVSLLTILAVGICLRLSFLFQPMRYDESYSFLKYASQPFYLALSNYSTPNNHIFHTILMRVAYLLLGNEPWMLRLPAFIAGVLMIPATYLFFSLLYNKKTALLASGLVAVSSMLVEFSTNARGYTLIGLISLLIFSISYCLVKDDKDNLGKWGIFAFLSALEFYTIPVFLYPFGTVFLWTFLMILTENEGVRKKKKLGFLFLSLILTATLTFLMYSPVILSQGIEPLVANPFVSPLPWSEFLTKLPELKIHLAMVNSDIPSFPSFLLLGGFFLSLAFHWKVASHKIPIALAFLGFIIPALLIQKVVPYNRIWLFVYPFYYGLASAGISLVFEKITIAVKNNTLKALIFPFFAISLTLLLALGVILSQRVYYSNLTGSFRDAKEITLFLRNYLKPGDRIFVYGYKAYLCYTTLPIITCFQLIFPKK